MDRNVGERIKKLRRELDLTQQEFADKIGSVQNTMTGYETGRRSPSNQVIALICREFNVNETWLRTGEGEMFMPMNKENQLMFWAGKMLAEESDSFKKRLVMALSNLKESDWEVLEQLVNDIVGEDRYKKS